jgi:PAS domain S-box-containing protein
MAGEQPLRRRGSSIRVHVLLFVLLAVLPAFALTWFAAVQGGAAAAVERSLALRDAAMAYAAAHGTQAADHPPRPAARRWALAAVDASGAIQAADAAFRQAFPAGLSDHLRRTGSPPTASAEALSVQAADGTTWWLALSALSGGSGWAVAAAREPDMAVTMEASLVALLLSGGGMLFGASLLIAFYASRRLGAPIALLERNARSFARGEPSAPPRPTGVTEVDSLAEALSRAAAERAERERERSALSARLEMVLATTSDAVLALDDAGRVVYMNHQAAAMLPKGGAGLGRRAVDLWPSGLLPALLAELAGPSRRAEATGFDPVLDRWIEAEAFRVGDGITVFLHDITQARALDEARRAEQARLQAILDHVPAGVLLVGTGGTLEFANRHAAELLGEAMRPGAMPEIQADNLDFLRALEGGASARGEAWVRRHDSGEVLLRFAAASLPASAGSSGATVIALTDLSDERRAADALRESELRFRTLAEAVPQIVWSASTDGVVDYVNPRFAEFTGLPDAIEARPGGGATHPADREHAAAVWQRSLRTGETFVSEYRLRGQGGEWRWFSAQALPAREPSGRITRWIGAATDVTDLIAARVALENQVMAEAAARQAAVAAAEALAASEERFRRFAEASPDVLWIADRAGRSFDYVSPAFERIWGSSRSDLLARPALWLDSIHAEDRTRVADTRRGRTDAPFEPFECEYRIQRPDGQERWIREIGFPVLDAAGRLARRGGFARDVTSAKHAEERQSLLIGELNHRVKNTLATVQSLALQTARGMATPSDPLRQFLTEFQSRLLALSRAHDILTARTWSGATLDEVVGASLAPWRPDGAPGQQRMSVDGPAVWLPPRAVLGLSLAFHELATNALKHGAWSMGAGRVRLNWQVDPDQTVQVRWVEEGGPPPEQPKHQGFGTRLLRKGLPAELGPGSEVSFEYLPAGFSADIRFRAAPLPTADAT